MSVSQMSNSKFSKSFFTMISLLILLTLFLVVLAHITSGGITSKLDMAKQEEIQKIVAARVQPVGKMNVGEPEASSENTVSMAESTPQPDAVAETPAGDAVYQQACAMCHAAGVAGAPKFGDAAAWADRIATGVDTLYGNALNGYQGKAGFMPAKGGNPALSDDAVRAAVDYMVGQSQ